MSKQEPPKIEFPCEGYPIKVIGQNGSGFEDLVIEVVQKHAPDLDSTEVSVQASRNGRFLSVRFRITATGPSQLKSIHQDLMATGRVQMVI
ncbi:DUF493 family protein [Motiliproteus sp. SC1-56]|uniref:DUF493 family protein n=1 Tax=Motiliproteus sp. SC1-56 TaxID=2799565 RepID=UPI001A9074C8|nr:DUF493 family protein [Motiliproteus sp. SC1-56]